jgi:hypothetical protein
MDFHNLTIPDLRKVVKQYNLHTIITRYYHLNKTKLINEMKKYLVIDKNTIKSISEFTFPIKEKEKLPKKEVVKKEPKKEVVKVIKKDEPKKEVVKVIKKDEPKKEVVKVIKKDEPKKESPEEKIINGWNDNYLGYLFDGTSYGENISKKINDLNDKNKYVLDYFLLSFIKGDIINEVINKYGYEKLMDGINRIAEHYGAEKYIKVFKGEASAILPKGTMKKQYAEQLFKLAKEAEKAKEEKEVGKFSIDEIKAYIESIEALNKKQPYAMKQMIMAKEYNKLIKQFLPKVINKDYDKAKEEILKFGNKYNIDVDLKGGNKYNGYALQTIIIKNKPFNEAHEEARNIMRTKKKKLFSRTLKNGSLHFRHIPKTKFIKKSFRSKKINDDITLVFGQLKPEHIHLEGSGLFDFIKDGFNFVKDKVIKGVEKVKSIFKIPDDFNNVSKRTIERYGKQPIASLSIYRTPIHSVLNGVLNLISENKFDELKKKYNYDKLFHLALVVRCGNKNIIVEKNEVVNISTEYKTSNDTEIKEVYLPVNFSSTLEDMLMNTLNRIGKVNFFDYDAFRGLNCQNFVAENLKTLNLYTPDIEDFVMQDVKELAQELPEHVKDIARGVTRTGAIFSKIIGKGKKKKIIIKK